MTRATPQLSLCSVSHHSQAVHWMEIGLVLLWLFFTYSQGVENAVADVTEWACCLLFCSEIPKKCQATYAWKDAVLALNKINIRKEFWTKRSFNCGLLWRKILIRKRIVYHCSINLAFHKLYMYIEKGKQINQKYTSNICKYISTFVILNTDQTLNWLEID